MSDPDTNPLSQFLLRLRARVRPISGPIASTHAKRQHRFFQTMSSQGRFPRASQWMHLPTLLSPTERLVFRAAATLFVISVLFVGVYAFATQRTLTPVHGGTYTEALIGAPQFINPLYASGNDTDQDLARLIYTGLMQWHPTDGLVTDLAESYTMSDDARVYTFTLRDDALWHDGATVTVRDVIFTFNAIQNPAYKSPHGGALRGVTIEQVNERTVAFTLEKPFAPFLSTLTIGILPAEYWSDLDPSTVRLAERNIAPIGSGPYAFDELTKDKRGAIQAYTLKRFSRFYRGVPYLDTLVFKFYPTVDDALGALHNRNVDGVAFVPKDQLGTVDRTLWQVVSPHLPQVTALFFNIKREFVEDHRVREPLAAAIDKDALLQDTLSQQGTVLHSLLLRETQEAAGVEITNPIGYDPDFARARLAELKFTEASPLSLTLTVVHQPELLAVADVVVAQWAAIGVTTKLNVVEPSAFRDDVLKSQSYDILLSGMLYGADPDPYPFWHSSQATYPGLNLTQYANRKADALIEEGRSQKDSERLATYVELARMVNETLPAIFLYQPTYTYVTTSKIRGIQLDSIVVPADRFGQIESWYLKARRRFGAVRVPVPSI